MTSNFTTIQISAIVCTRNRVDYLAKSLQSLIDQSLSPSLFEIIIVDNGSEDTTKVYVDTLLNKSSEYSINYIFEPVVGLSKARNSGCAAAHGEYVAFLDDDAIASRLWLENILAAFKRAGPAVKCVGGKIDLIWEKERPAWLYDALLSPLGKLDISQSCCLLSHGQYLFGGNFAILRSALEEAGMFNTMLGRRGIMLMSNEEVELQNRLFENGYERYYDPEILIFHHARKECISRIWHLRRRYCQGVSEGIQLGCTDNEHGIDIGQSISFIKHAFWELLFDINGVAVFVRLMNIAYHIGRTYGIARNRS